MNDSASASSDIQGALKQELNRRFKTIGRQYAAYVRCILTSLEAKNVTVENLRTYILSLPAFKSDENRHHKLMSGREELISKAAIINDIIDVITTMCASFLDYEIFGSIVEEYELNKGQKQFQYPQYLRTYIDAHKISEFMQVNSDLDKYSDAEEIVLKFNTDLSSHKFATIVDLKNAIADILEVSSLSLRLLSVKDGCVTITFLIPKYIATVIFAGNEVFTSKQIKEFQDLSLLWLKCDSYEFSFETETAG